MRRHGCEWPLNHQQVGAAVLYLALALMFHAVSARQLRPTPASIAVHVADGAASIVVIVAYFVTSLMDPTDPRVLHGVAGSKSGAMYCSHCKTDVGRRSKHCKICDRCVDIFDHHCAWLNNCIGRRNYNAFYTLIWTVFLQLILQASVAAAAFGESFADGQSYPVDTDQVFAGSVSPNGARTLLAIAAVLAGGCAVPIGELVALHWVLRRKHLTTFEYIIAARDQREAEALRAEEGRAGVDAKAKRLEGTSADEASGQAAGTDESARGECGEGDKQEWVSGAEGRPLSGPLRAAQMGRGPGGKESAAPGRPKVRVSLSVCAALRLPPAPPPAPLPSTSGAALPTLLRAPSRVAPAPHGAVPDDRGSRASSLGAGGVRLTPLSRELSAAHVSDASYRPSSVAERAGCIDGRQRVWTPRRARPSGRDPVAGTMDKQSSTGGGPATYQQSLASSRPRGSRPPPAPTPPSPLASTALSHARSSRALSHSTQEGQPPAEDAPRVPLRGFGPASLRRAPPPMPTHPEAGLGAAGGLGAVGEGLGEEAGESEGTGAFWAGEV